MPALWWDDVDLVEALRIVRGLTARIALHDRRVARTPGSIVEIRLAALKCSAIGSSH